MKLTLREITNKYQALKTLIDKKMPARLSYAISRNLVTIEEETKNIDDSRIKIAETYAEKNEDGTCKIIGNHYVISDIEAFNAEIENFYNTEIEINICVIDSYEINKLEDPRYDVLTPSEITTLDFMLIDNQKTDN